MKQHPTNPNIIIGRDGSLFHDSHLWHVGGEAGVMCVMCDAPYESGEARAVICKGDPDKAI